MNMLETPLPTGDLESRFWQHGVHDDLRRTARGEIALNESFLVIGWCAEEQRLAAANLLEREVWVMRALLEASDAIWGRLPSPTLRFALDGHDLDAPHLQLGRFAHLAALAAPSAAEQQLIEATKPCWARATPDRERQRAGFAGPLALAYEPVSDEEAVRTLSYQRIMSQLEETTRTAAKLTLAEALSQQERLARLRYTEEILGWRPEPATAGDAALPLGTRLLLATVGHGSYRPAASLACLGLLGLVLYFLIGTPQALIVLLLLGPCLLIWQYTRR
jgi:hypothetical protein